MTAGDIRDIDHLCVVLLSGLGDVVNGLPVVNALRAANPSLRITWVVEPMPAAILEGTIALAEKRNDDAIRFLTNAVAAEDTLHYAEPESWRLPARHFLGQAYLQTLQWEDAQKVFEEDLLDHPYNFWAISGLKESLYQSFKLPERQALMEKYAQAFKESDIKLKGAAY